MININNRYCPDYELCYRKAYKTLIFDVELFYDLVMDEYLEIERYYKKSEKKVITLSLWKAMSIFDEEVPSKYRIKVKKEDIQVEKAKEVNVCEVLNNLGIRHNRGRCKTPFVDNSSNNTAFQFKDNKYICHRTGNKGDTINLVMTMMNKDFLESVHYLNSL